jgi:hypothetical protein
MSLVYVTCNGKRITGPISYETGVAYIAAQAPSSTYRYALVYVETGRLASLVINP